MTLWDLSPAIHPGLAVWPGDTRYAEERTWHLDHQCPVNVSRITLSTHTGSHADAPLHFDPEGEAIGAVPLDPYIGPCRLIDVTASGPLVKPEVVQTGLDPGVRRVLLRTTGRSDPDRWPAGFTALHPATADMLGERGIVLIGIDTPSMDPEESKAMPAHKAIRRHRMAILEGLVLAGIPPGDYELIAPPLKLANADAAPVRALLRDLP